MEVRRWRGWTPGRRTAPDRRCAEICSDPRTRRSSDGMPGSKCGRWRTLPGKGGISILPRTSPWCGASTSGKRWTAKTFRNFTPGRITLFGQPPLWTITGITIFCPPLWKTGGLKAQRGTRTFPRRGKERPQRILLAEASDPTASSRQMQRRPANLTRKRKRVSVGKR